MRVLLAVLVLLCLATESTAGPIGRMVSFGRSDSCSGSQCQSPAKANITDTQKAAVASTPTAARCANRGRSSCQHRFPLIRRVLHQGLLR